MAIELKGATLKALDASGEGEALFALWAPASDLDGDQTERGFFGNGVQEVFMIPHHNWTSGEPPIGKGTIWERPEGAVYAFKMNLGTERGRSWHSHLLFDIREGTKPRQVYSYGFRVVDGGGTARTDGFKGRRLHATSAGQPGALVIEVAPVTAAAQPLSRTLMAKAPLTRGQHQRALEIHRHVLKALMARHGAPIPADHPMVQRLQLAVLKGKLHRAKAQVRSAYVR